MKKAFLKTIGNHSGLMLLLVLPVMASCFYALMLPVSFDEAATFLFFTNKGFTESISHYPAPNNHVLHSVLTNITKHIPGFPVLLKMRISSLVINFITLIVLYKFIAKHFSTKLALFVVAIGSMLFLNLYYSYMSRGYALINLFFVLNLNCSFNIIKEENLTRNWMAFSLFSILGFYTLPSYLYPFLTLNSFIFVFQPKRIKTQLVFGLLILSIVSTMYLPIISNEGLSAITNNTYVKSVGLLQTLKSLPLYYLFTIQEITGIHWIVIVLTLVVSNYLIVKSKNKLHIALAIIMIAAPFVLLSLHRVLPFARVFNYYGFVIVLLIIIPFQNKLESLNLKILIPALLVLQGLLWFHFDSKIYSYEDKDQALNMTVAKIIPKIIGDKKYLSNKSLLVYNLEFELISKGFKNYQVKEVHYPKMSADTISDYDYIIITKEEDFTAIKKPMIVTKYYSIYGN